MKKQINNHFFSIAVTLLVILAGCRKGNDIESYNFTKMVVQSRLLLDVPELSVFVNDVAIGNVAPGSSIGKLIPREDKAGAVTLFIKDAGTGETYLDTSFQPNKLNEFTVLIDRTLGIHQFVTDPSDDTPIPAEHYRIQLVNRIKKNDVEKKVTFKLYIDSTNTYVKFTELEQKFENVAYGNMSAVVDVPRSRYRTSPIRPWIVRNIYIKAFDAETGELLVDMSPSGLLSSAIVVSKHSVMVPTTIDDSGTSALAWSEYYQWPGIQF